MLLLQAQEWPQMALYGAEMVAEWVGTGDISHWLGRRLSLLPGLLIHTIAPADIYDMTLKGIPHQSHFPEIF
jgi:hypothetical protein